MELWPRHAIHLHLPSYPGILGERNQSHMHSHVSVVHPFCRQHTERYCDIHLTHSTIMEHESLDETATSPHPGFLIGSSVSVAPCQVAALIIPALLTLWPKQLRHLGYQDQISTNRELQPRCHVREPRCDNMDHRRGMPRYYLRLPSDSASSLRPCRQGEVYKSATPQPGAA